MKINETIKIMKKIKKYFLITAILVLLILAGFISNNKLIIASIAGAKGIIQRGVSVEEILYRKVIADNATEQDVKNFEDRGCKVRHRLSNAVSFKCPRILKPRLFAAKLIPTRNVEKFHIMDLESNAQIGADKVWNEGITGSGVKVAILDTGIDLNHPELRDIYIGGYDFIFDDEIPEDEHGHGSHVAGIIAGQGVDANAKGVAPGAKIYMFKVCDSGGTCYGDAMMAGMEAAAATDAKIVSVSLGSIQSYIAPDCDNNSLAIKINWLVDQGITAVVAAGNDGRGVSAPGCASKVISVGAVDKDNSVTWFSGRGDALDIVAPGKDIYSSIIDGYASYQGTSMATPHVAGVIALLLETDPTLTTEQIKTILYETANAVNKCYQSGHEGPIPCGRMTTGAGIVNAYHAYLLTKCENCRTTQ